MDPSRSLAEIVAWLFDAEPLAAPEIERRARLLFLDTLGCMIAGLAKPEPAALLDAMAALEPGNVRLPGAGRPLTAGSAAYIAGLAACWDEACEGLPRAHGRPGLHAFAPVLALGLARNHDLGQTLAALVAGFEVGGRLGEYLRIRPGMHVDGIWGTFASVTGAARLLGLPASTAVAALQGAACQLPYSLYLPISHGATVRNAYVGEAARRGIAMALAAAAGVTMPPGDAIEGFDRLALGHDGPAKVLVRPGQWLIEEGYLKPFAAVRHVHYGAQAAIDWRGRHDQVDTAEITALELAIYGEAMTYCGNRAPVTPIQAQFSLSYGLAWTLFSGDLGPQAYHGESLNNREVRRLEALVNIVEEPAFTKANKRAARLTVGTAQGAADTLDVDAVPGDVDMPLPDADVGDKFVRYVTPILGPDRAVALASSFMTAPLSSSLVELLSD
ncbi:MAG: MmgE/PrpD family protein [Alphaproteobacteria bacterium]|jgi:2-methylcitrate dehydratase PrpD|nr:MmgE/PrpD family protein [Alphaproteobacteria bacterium]